MTGDVKTDSLSPILYISHGGGPLPLLGDESHQELVANLKYLSTLITRPAAIIVISAHWEEEKPTITSGTSPQLIYDYYGFPKEAYAIQYPAPGNPDLANILYDLLSQYNIKTKLDDQRGFDHGLFVPLKIMYPSAEIPCIQISLVKGLNPVEHLQIGKALSSLRSRNVLIIGSGFSFHNLRALFEKPTTEAQSLNESFENWLIKTCNDAELSEIERENRFVNWEVAPGARYCHPREEHLIPLHVCYGVAGKAAQEAFRFEVMKKRASAYLW